MDRSRALVVGLALSTACVLVPEEDDGNADGTTEGPTGDPTAGTTATTATTTSPTGSVDSSGTTDPDPTTSTGGADGSSGDIESANDRCPALCEAIANAACDSGPTEAGCLLTCEVLTSAETCDPTAHTYFDCVDETAVTCDALGEPIAEGCGIVYLEAVGCAVTENPNPDIVEPCATQCESIVTAACPNNGTSEECNTNCLWLGATGTGCDDEWATYLECTETAVWSCLLGFAVAEGCGADFGAYTECINAAASG